MNYRAYAHISHQQWQKSRILESMQKYLCVLGRQPKLGHAELEAVYGASTIALVREGALVDAEVDIHKLGGTQKVARLLHILDTTRWTDIEDYLIKNIPKHLEYLPEGKMTLGISVYDLPINARTVSASALKIKKIIRGTGRPIRIVPNKQLELNSAQVIHNKLTSSGNWELILMGYGQKTILAQTVSVQDIAAYGARDQERPKRDARVGMLPPKLAQIIINVAQPEAGYTLLDPFCGTGVLLQEALLMGINVYGTDLEPRMIEYSKINLQWLKDTFGFSGAYDLAVGDATNRTWSSKIDVVACETYLGKPLTVLPAPRHFDQIVDEVSELHEKFLRNLASQIKNGTRLSVAVPAWKTPRGFRHLPVLDSLGELGYTRPSFTHVLNDDLIYHRDGQIVARELVVLIRN